MPALIALKQIACPRNKTVQVMIDLDPLSENQYIVGSYYRGRVYKMTGYKQGVNAVVGFEDEALLPGPEGDSSWLAVLARCTGKPARPASWDGSAAEYAARFAQVGTWEWVQILAAYRKLTDEVTLKNKNNEGTYATAELRGIPPGSTH